MPQVTQRKNRSRHSLTFNALQEKGFAQVTLSASVANTTISGRQLFILPSKIFRVVANVSGSPAGTCSINIVAGVAAEGGVGTPDTSDNGVNAYPIPIAVAGTQLFSSDQALGMVADVPTIINVPADLFDVVWQGLVTLRIVTNGAAAGNLNVTLLIAPTDTNPPQGSYGSITQGSVTGQGSFTPATALP